MSATWSLVLSVLSCFLGSVSGNGYMIDPPARSSMWRVGYDTPINYDDMSINCGGYYRHWFENDGRCGICGDPYDLRRHNEAGGIYAQGIITRTYKTGGVLPIRVNLTSSHGGWFEFRLCENNDVTKTATPECFEMNLLRLVDDDSTRFTGVPVGGLTNPQSILLEYRLPAGVTCNHCVLQWIYNTGKDWGCDESGVCALGLGKQEQFIGCSDIGITVDGSPVPTMNGGTTPANGGNNKSTSGSNTGVSKSTTGTGTGVSQSTAKSGSETTRAGGIDTPKTTARTIVESSRTTTVSMSGTGKTTRGAGTDGSKTTPGSGTATGKTTGGLRTGTGKTASNGVIASAPPTPPLPTSTSLVPLGECKGRGVLQNIYDNQCRQLCTSPSACPKSFCNDKCHLRARQLEECNQKGYCSI